MDEQGPLPPTPFSKDSPVDFELPDMEEIKKYIVDFVEGRLDLTNVKDNWDMKTGRCILKNVDTGALLFAQYYPKGFEGSPIAAIEIQMEQAERWVLASNMGRTD